MSGSETAIDRLFSTLLTDEETVALLRELDGLIDADRYFLSQRIKTLYLRGISRGATRIGISCGSPGLRWYGCR